MKKQLAIISGSLILLAGCGNNDDGNVDVSQNAVNIEDGSGASVKITQDGTINVNAGGVKVNLDQDDRVEATKIEAGEINVDVRSGDGVKVIIPGLSMEAVR